MAELALTPEHSNALRIYQELLAELPFLEEEKARLLGHEIPFLNAMYMKELGELRLQLLNRQYDTFALRRKMEMVRSALTRGVPVVSEVIDRLVEEELRGQREKLDHEVRELEKAMLMLKSAPLTDEEAAEFKSLYHRLAKMLHPDLNPEQDPTRLELWLKVVAAYKSGDLHGLRLLSVLSEEGGVVLQSKSFTVLEELLRRNNYLIVAVDRLKSEIETIKNNFPYTIREVISDPEWLDAQRESIAHQINASGEEATYYQNQIDRLMQQE
ncbi:MAG: hypothetical protein ACKOA1_11710 [Bacteroidota bacterium]